MAASTLLRALPIASAFGRHKRCIGFSKAPFWLGYRAPSALGCVSSAFTLTRAVVGRISKQETSHANTLEHAICPLSLSFSTLSPTQDPESIRLRNAYSDPLNHLQIRFLPRWLCLKESESLPRLMVLTVHGSAFGMKSKG